MWTKLAIVKLRLCSTWDNFWLKCEMFLMWKDLFRAKEEIIFKGNLDAQDAKFIELKLVLMECFPQIFSEIHRKEELYFTMWD